MLPADSGVVARGSRPAGVSAWAVLSTGCVCATEILSGAASTDRRYVASVVERDCGATTDYVTYVNLRDTTEILQIPTETVLFRAGDARAETLWEGTRLLRIASACISARRTDTWRDVRVLYEPLRSRPQATSKTNDPVKRLPRP